MGKTKAKVQFLSSTRPRKSKQSEPEADINALVPVVRADVQDQGSFDLALVDSMKSLHQVESVARYMSSKCTGEKFVAVIQGKPYPTVAWWTTVGAAFGLFPREIMSRKLNRPNIVYESLVEICNGGRVIGRASAICSASEIRWSGRDEYAIKSMATTRATSKAYKLGFSFLAVLAGLEATPAEEMVLTMPSSGTKTTKKKKGRR